MGNRTRTITDYPRNSAGLVDNFIGTAYDTVKTVHDNLDQIETVYQNNDAINYIHDNITLINSIPNLTEQVNNEYSLVLQLSNNEENIPVTISDEEYFSAKHWAIKSEKSADRVDLGALDDAVAVTTADRIQTNQYREAAQQAMITALDHKGKAEIARAAAESAALTLGAVIYETRVALFANTGTADARGYVYADATEDYNGLYFWTGSAWQKDALDSGLRISELSDRVAALEYVPPSIVNLRINGGNIYEVGQSITPTLLWGYSGSKPRAAQLLNSTAIGTNATSWTDSTARTSNQTYTLEVTDDQGGTANASVTLTFRRRGYWGVSQATSLTGTQVAALTPTDLITSRARTLTYDASQGGGNNYIYYAYPVSFGAPTELKIGGFQTSFVSQIVSVTNSHGATTDYYVLRNTVPQNGNNINAEWI